MRYRGGSMKVHSHPVVQLLVRVPSANFKKGQGEWSIRGSRVEKAQLCLLVCVEPPPILIKLRVVSMQAYFNKF